MNKAFLTKLAWRIITRSEEPWCKVLRAKYGLLENDPLHFKARQHLSNIWQGLVWCSDLLHARLRWEISNGKRVLFWKDLWVGKKPLLQCCLQPVEERALAALICSFWKEGRGWRWDDFTSFLSASFLL